MRTTCRLLLILLAGCGCAPYYEATAAYREAMATKSSNSESSRAQFERAQEAYRQSLAECRLSPVERMQATSMITRCLLELDRFADADELIQTVAEALEEAYGDLPLAGDPLASGLFRAQYALIVGRRALEGIQINATDPYVDRKLGLAHPYYAEALERFRTPEPDPEIALYLRVKEAGALLEWSRGYAMPKTPSRKRNLEKARDLLQQAAERSRDVRGAYLEKQAARIHSEAIKDLDWVEREIKRAE